MKTSLDCLPCFLKQTIIALRLSGASEELQKEVISAVSDEIKRTDFTRPPAWTTTFIHKRIRDILAMDPFERVKSEYNQKALSIYPDLKRLVSESPDPLWTAVRLAIAGNVIDFGISTTIDIEGTIKKALDGLSIDHFEAFRKGIYSSKSLLYLLDNAGEIVFDRLLIEVLKDMGIRVTAVVKGEPVLNDCTYRDAQEIHLDSVAEVIDNGSYAIGTIPELSSEHFRKILEESPIIISKGQGNFETLSTYLKERGTGSKKVFFLFQSKCEVVSRELGLPVGSMLLSSWQVSA